MIQLIQYFTMAYIFYLFLFIFGLAFGSFLNVVSLRYKPDQKLFDLKIIGGRSRCPICKKQLSWYELIPLFSFVFQRRKCRHCGHKISLQYPIVEFLSGLVFVFVPLHFNLFSEFYFNYFSFFVSLIWVVIFLLFLLLAIIDFREYIIPDEINILLAILGIVLIILNSYMPSQTTISNLQPSFLGFYSMMFGSFGNIWVSHIAAAALSLVFFGLVIVLSRGKGMGIGDLKLAGVLGLIFGWPDIVLVLCLAFIIGALLSIFLLFNKRKKIKDAVPFGPFLTIGAVLVFFLGFQIVNLYFGIFSIYF